MMKEKYKCIMNSKYNIVKGMPIFVGVSILWFVNQNICVRNRLYMRMISIDNLSNWKNKTARKKRKTTKKKKNKPIIKTKWHSAVIQIHNVM